MMGSIAAPVSFRQPSHRKQAPQAQGDTGTGPKGQGNTKAGSVRAAGCSQKCRGQSRPRPLSHAGCRDFMPPSPPHSCSCMRLPPTWTRASAKSMADVVLAHSFCRARSLCKSSLGEYSTCGTIQCNQDSRGGAPTLCKGRSAVSPPLHMLHTTSLTWHKYLQGQACSRLRAAHTAGSPSG